MPDQLESDTPVIRKNEIDDGGEHDPQYEPIVTLPLVSISTNEEEEVEMCKIRARLYRFDKVDREWKERGTGDIKLLHHHDNNTVRVVMRRDKTLKLCANHFITEDLHLNPHIGSDRAFNWTTLGDFADETTKQEFLAVKFGNVDNANLWKNKFAEAIEIVKSKSLNNTNNTISNSSGVSESECATDTSGVLSEEKSADPIVEPSDKSVDGKVDEFASQLSELKLEKESEAAVE